MRSTMQLGKATASRIGAIYKRFLLEKAAVAAHL